MKKTASAEAAYTSSSFSSSTQQPKNDNPVTTANNSHGRRKKRNDNNNNNNNNNTSSNHNDTNTETTRTTHTTNNTNANVNTTATTSMIREGSVCMTVPAGHDDTSVFYNPVQVQNRDLSILIIAVFLERRHARHCRQTKKTKTLPLPQPRDPELEPCPITQMSSPDNGDGMLHAAVVDDDDRHPVFNVPPPPPPCRILDALAASGLRSLRYWNELRGSVGGDHNHHSEGGEGSKKGRSSTRSHYYGGVQHITINDLEPSAVERAYQNVHQNHLSHVLTQDPLGEGIRIHQGDAMDLLYQSRIRAGTGTGTGTGGRGGTLTLPPQPHGQSPPPPLPPPPPPSQQRLPPWTIIDLDPYGSAAPFLDGAVQAVENHGLLCVTCTDMAALAGARPETCFGRYHALPIQRAGYVQEMALRILLYTLATTAATYGRTIRPLLSVGMDFYVRVFVEVVESKAAVQELCLKVGHVYQSTLCPSFHILPTAVLGGPSNRVYQASRVVPQVCAETGAPFKVGGPMWLGPLHDVEIIRKAQDRLLEGSTAAPQPHEHVLDIQFLATAKRLRGLLELCHEELEQAPLYYKLPDLCSAIHMSCPPRQLLNNAIVNAGYQVSVFHKEAQAVKTNAPNQVVWDILRTWYWKNHPHGNNGMKQVDSIHLDTHEHEKERDSTTVAATTATGSISSATTKSSKKARKASSSSAPVEGSTAHTILSRPITTSEIDFTDRGQNDRIHHNPQSHPNHVRRSGVARFPLNPEPHWGPKSRATGSASRKKRRNAVDVVDHDE